MDEWIEYASDNLSPIFLTIAILALPVYLDVIIINKDIIRGKI